MDSSRWKRKTGTDRRKRKKFESGEDESRRVRHVDDHGWSVKSAQDLSHECAMCIIHQRL